MTTLRTYRMPPATLAQLAALMRSFEIPVTESAVVRLAIERLAEDRARRPEREVVPADAI